MDQPPPARLPRQPRPVRHSVREQVTDRLRAALASGDLAPGTLHSAPVLALRFGTSATPVREAMQQLAAEGLVHTEPNRGFRVAQPPGPREAAELAEVRALLEVPVVTRLAEAVPGETWERLRPLAEAASRAAAHAEAAAYAEADRAFHRALLDLGGNARLVDVAQDVQRRAQRAPRPPAAPTAHHRLLDALAAGDAAAAAAVLRAHLSAGT